MKACGCLLLGGLLLLGIAMVMCGDKCFQTVASAASPSGTLVAEAVVSGFCGGATVGYHTAVKIRRDVRWWFDASRHVFAARGSFTPKLRWTGPRRLEIAYAGIVHADIPSTVRKETRWSDVEIVYRTE
ncbi:MAG: hypothetical protein R2729_24405 [Bryobacteraceae bacterium]